MRVLRFSLALILLASLTGCLSSVSGASGPPEKVAARTDVEYDDFDNVLHLRGPWFHRGLGVTYQIRATMSKTDGSAIYSVYVEDEWFVNNRGGHDEDGKNPGHGFAGNARNFYTARDPGGQRFEVLSSGTRFDGCRDVFCYYEEDFAILLPDGYLEAVGGEGLRLRASSEAKIYIDLKIPSDYIAGILMRVAEERAKLAR